MAEERTPEQRREIMRLIAERGRAQHAFLLGLEKHMQALGWTEPVGPVVEAILAAARDANTDVVLNRDGKFLVALTGVNLREFGIERGAQ